MVFIFGVYNNLLSFRFFSRNQTPLFIIIKAYINIWNFLLNVGLLWTWLLEVSNRSQKPWGKQRHYHHRDANRCIVDLIHDKVINFVLFFSFDDWLGMCFHFADFWDLITTQGSYDLKDTIKVSLMALKLFSALELQIICHMTFSVEINSLC